MGNDTVRIEKSKIDIYKIRHEKRSIWGNICVEFGESSAILMINSDYGSYAYNWFATGNNPKKFLCGLDMEYAMNKLTEGNLYEPDESKYADEVKKKIIDKRRDGYITKEVAREAWDDMMEILSEYSHSGDILYHELMSAKHSGKVFIDFEEYPSATRVKPKHQHFWNEIWMPFIEELKMEMENE